MTRIQFDNGSTVTIRDGDLAAPALELTAILDTPAAALPGYGGIAFVLDDDFNMAQGLIDKIGLGKIVYRDRIPVLPRDIAV